MKKFNGGKNGIEGFYLAPNHPEVNPYLISIFKDLIENYDLDGLHLDYVRFHDSDYGQNSFALSSFQKEIGVSDLKTFNSTQSSQWNDYRRKSVTDLVRETKNLIQSVKPNISLTAAVKPNLYQARERFFQEWDVWLAAGYLDKAIDKIKYSRVTRFNSISFFSYTVMYKEPSYFKSIKNALYPRN